MTGPLMGRQRCALSGVRSTPKNADSYVRRTGVRLQRAMLVLMRRLAIMCSFGIVMTSRTRRQSRRWLGVFLRPTGLRSAQYAVYCLMAHGVIFLPANITLWSLMRLSASGSGGGVSTGPYSKLVPRQLLIDNGIRFEEGVINEDVLWTAEVLTASSSVAFLGEPLYHYIAREGSVTGTFDSRVAIVFDNCRRLKHFVLELFLSSKKIVPLTARAPAGASFFLLRGVRTRSGILMSMRGLWSSSPKGKRTFPGFARRLRILVLRILVRMRLYGLLRK